METSACKSTQKIVRCDGTTKKKKITTTMMIIIISNNTLNAHPLQSLCRQKNYIVAQQCYGFLGQTVQTANDFKKTAIPAQKDYTCP
jgi:hypothetical protein